MFAIDKGGVPTEIEFIPVTLVKHAHYEQAYECKRCKVHASKASIKTGKAPKPTIQNRLASPSVLAKNRSFSTSKSEAAVNYYAYNII